MDLKDRITIISSTLIISIGIMSVAFIPDVRPSMVPSVIQKDIGISDKIQEVLDGFFPEVYEVLFARYNENRSAILVRVKRDMDYYGLLNITPPDQPEIQDIRLKDNGFGVFSESFYGNTIEVMIPTLNDAVQASFDATFSEEHEKPTVLLVSNNTGNSVMLVRVEYGYSYNKKIKDVRLKNNGFGIFTGVHLKKTIEVIP